MNAVVVRRHGDESVLRLEERPEPSAGPGEVVVRIRAAGVNFADILARLGLYKAAPPPPFIPGIEVSGVVEACGPGATSLKPGDRVMSFSPFGGYAEKTVVQESYAFPIPEDMGFPEAAALPVQYLTAYHGLFHLAHVRPGETVLVHAAAGGVGLAILQLCEEAGAKVVATVGSAKKVEAVKAECPSARVVVMGEEDFVRAAREATGGRGPDVIMDSLGGATFSRGWKSLAPGGRHILFGAASAVKPGAISKMAAGWRLLPMLWIATLPMIDGNKTLSAFNLYHLASDAERLHGASKHLLELRAKGSVKPRITLSLPLEKAAEAHRRVQNRETTGKVILTVG